MIIIHGVDNMRSLTIALLVYLIYLIIVVAAVAVVVAVFHPVRQAAEPECWARVSADGKVIEWKPDGCRWNPPKHILRLPQ
jgi:cell division protein FtsL